MSKEKKIFQIDKKEICITASQIKQAIDLLVNENEILQKENERLNNIIKEAREYIKDYFYIDKETGEYYLTHTFGSSNLYELSKILDKVSDKE